MKLSKDWEILLKQAELVGFTVEHTPSAVWVDEPGGAWRFLIPTTDEGNVNNSPELMEEFVKYVKEMLDYMGEE